MLTLLTRCRIATKLKLSRNRVAQIGGARRVEVYKALKGCTGMHAQRMRRACRYLLVISQRKMLVIGEEI
jgi:hypothetical protein